GELPQLLPREEAETTAAAWLKGELVPKVVAALNDARRGRLVWLMITDLNRCDAYGSFTSEFLYLLYEQVLTNDWLRVVLDGMKGDIPATLRQVTIRHDVPAVTEAEIRTYLQRRLTELGVTGIDSQALAAAVPLLHQIYLITNRDVAIRGLASAAQDVVHRIAAGD
ncbi:MAG TPA: hypothetical protein VL371_02415, partial [Gemmataceae bacterium]|nr:hypothetical protein [Gemmataceae bacterium]